MLFSKENVKKLGKTAAQIKQEKAVLEMKERHAIRKIERFRLRVKKNSLKEEKTPQMQKFNTRKYGYCAARKHQNFVFVFGCKSTKFVDANTQMVHEIAQAINTRYSTEDLTLEIPDVFENLSS